MVTAASLLGFRKNNIKDSSNTAQFQIPHLSNLPSHYLAHAQRTCCSLNPHPCHRSSTAQTLPKGLADLAPLAVSAPAILRNPHPAVTGNQGQEQFNFLPLLPFPFQLEPGQVVMGMHFPVHNSNHGNFSKSGGSQAGCNCICRSKESIK